MRGPVTVAVIRPESSQVKIFPLYAFFLLQAASTAGLAADNLTAGGGMAIGDLWEASAAEYQASAEALLARLGARNIEHADLAGSMMADFLRMFGGGGGAPLDLVRPSTAAFGNE